MGTTNSKTVASKAIINTWLNDNTVYCNNCDTDYNKDIHLYESCCDNPQFGRNIDHCKGVIEQNKKDREDLNSDTGSNNSKTMRYAVSLPPRLLFMLEEYYRKHGEKLFNNGDELHEFMRAFPAFAVARRV